MTYTPEQKIHILFANATQIEFNAQRYGMKSCRDGLSFDLLDDLRQIYLRAIELDECESTEEQELDTCYGCSLATIEETIKTI